MKSSWFGPFSGLLVFLIVAPLSLREPSLQFGLAIGTENLIISLLISFLASFVAATIVHFIASEDEYSWKMAFGCFAAALVIAVGLNDGLLKFADARFDLGRKVASAKVHFYCVKEFAAADCVNQLSQCPDCKNVIPANARNDLQLKLTIFAQIMDQRARDAEAARHSGPLSEAAQKWQQKQSRQPGSNSK